MLSRWDGTVCRWGLGREGLVLQQLREAHGLYDTNRAAARLLRQVLADLENAQVGSKAGGQKREGGGAYSFLPTPSFPLAGGGGGGG